MAAQSQATGELEVSRLTKEFGGLVAIDNVTFQIEANSLVGLMGPNGAGKSTLIDMVSGNLQPSSGTISIDGNDVPGDEAPHLRIQRGVAKTFQDKLIFEKKTIWNNVEPILHAISATEHRIRSGALADIKEPDTDATIENLLTFVGIPAEEWSTKAENVSIFHRTKLSIGMALATFPSILLLDEPMAGLNTKESEEIIELISKLHDNGMTVVLIEHDIETVLGLCNRILVLHLGELIADDEPAAIREHQAVRDAYIGTG